VRRLSSTWLRSSALALALPGCLVSFTDYPLGDPNADAPKTLLGGAGSGLPSAGSSSAGKLAAAGSSATGGSTTAGTGNAADVTPTDLLVDDFEDTDPQLLELQGRRRPPASRSCPSR
jgi:hypothetical protein